MREGRLDKVPVRFADKACCCVILASGGYPGSYKKGLPIFGVQQAEKAGCTVFHAGTARKDGLLVTSGGRVLGVSATGGTLRQAVDAAYAGVQKIAFHGAFYRQDIARKDAALGRPGQPVRKGPAPKGPQIDWS